MGILNDKTRLGAFRCRLMSRSDVMPEPKAADEAAFD
jgi:hypothetical protein